MRGGGLSRPPAEPIPTRVLRARSVSCTRSSRSRDVFCRSPAAAPAALLSGERDGAGAGIAPRRRCRPGGCYPRRHAASRCRENGIGASEKAISPLSGCSDENCPASADRCCQPPPRPSPRLPAASSGSRRAAITPSSATFHLLQLKVSFIANYLPRHQRSKPALLATWAWQKRR